MDEKTLVIYYDNGDKPIFRDCFKRSGIRCRSWLKNNVAFLIYNLIPYVRILGRLFRNRIYYYPDNMDGLIIIFDTKITERYLKKIKAINPRAKIIIWYWNEINNSKILKLSHEFDIWSYSPADCRDYGLIYNPQFYFDSIVEQYRDIFYQEKIQGEQSFIFIGRDKERSELIHNIADEIKKTGWGCQTEFLSTSRTDKPHNKELKYSAGFSYSKYMEKVLKYQGILDVAYKENSGLSLRTMESIFFHKKLITTNQLVKSYDFYDENNIYIWGQSEMSLDEFLLRPYRPVSKSICEKYLISSWLSRIKEYYGIE